MRSVRSFLEKLLPSCKILNHSTDSERIHLLIRYEKVAMILSYKLVSLRHRLRPEWMFVLRLSCAFSRIIMVESLMVQCFKGLSGRLDRIKVKARGEPSRIEDDLISILKDYKERSWSKRSSPEELCMELIPFKDLTYASIGALQHPKRAREETLLPTVLTVYEAFNGLIEVLGNADDKRAAIVSKEVITPWWMFGEEERDHLRKLIPDIQLEIVE